MSTTIGEDWTQYLLRPQAMRTVYKSSPSFVVLHELGLHRDGPRADVRLELDRFADTPPKRWDPRFNRVQVVLSFSGLQEISVERFGWYGTLSQGVIEKNGEEITFRFVGPDVSVSGVSRTADVCQISGYLDST